MIFEILWFLFMIGLIGIIYIAGLEIVVGVLGFVFQLIIRFFPIVLIILFIVWLFS